MRLKKVPILSFQIILTISSLNWIHDRSKVEIYGGLEGKNFFQPKDCCLRINCEIQLSYLSKRRKACLLANSSPSISAWGRSKIPSSVFFTATIFLRQPCNRPLKERRFLGFILTKESKIWGNLGRTLKVEDTTSSLICHFIHRAWCHSRQFCWWIYLFCSGTRSKRVVVVENKEKNKTEPDRSKVSFSFLACKWPQQKGFLKNKNKKKTII